MVGLEEVEDLSVEEKGFVVYGDVDTNKGKEGTVSEGTKDVVETGEGSKETEGEEKKDGNKDEAVRFYGFEGDDTFTFGEDVDLFAQDKWYKEYLTPLILGAVILVTLIVRIFFFTVVIISGESMLPTMENYELALVNKYSSVDNYERGQVIIFEGDSTYVKRIIALGGDTVAIDNNKVLVNGEVLDEKNYLDTDLYALMSDMDEVKVPKDSFFVMGDNRGNSMDSRNGLGMPTKKDIVGEVVTHAAFPVKFD